MALLERRCKKVQEVRDSIDITKMSCYWQKLQRGDSPYLGFIIIFYAQYDNIFYARTIFSNVIKFTCPCIIIIFYLLIKKIKITRVIDLEVWDMCNR